MAMDLYDFADKNGNSEIAEWRQSLTKRSQGALDQKLHMLRENGVELSRKGKMLAGPIPKTKHIYKLRISVDGVQLRPMLCKGPFQMDVVCTILVGAKEVQSKLTPDPQKAVDNRETLLKDKKRRVPHEW